MVSWTKCAPPQKNAYVEAHATSGAVFGDDVSREIKLNEMIKVGPCFDRISVLIRKETRELLGSLCPHSCTAERPHEEARKKAAMDKSGGDSSPETETDSAGTLILDLQLPDSEKINFCCLSYVVYGILLW